MAQKIAAGLRDLVENHKFIRRAFMAWSVVVSTFAIWCTYMVVDEITAPVASALGIVLGLLNAPTGYYFVSRSRDDQRRDPNGG